jgi:hypothetical protein
MKKGRWCPECIALRIRYAGEGDARLRAGFYDMLAVLILNDKVDLSSVLALIIQSLEDLNAAFQPGKMAKAAAQARETEPRMHLPTADAFHLSLAKRDATLMAAVGTPPPVHLLLALLRCSTWAKTRQTWRFLQRSAGGQLVAHRAVGLALLQYLHDALQEPHACIMPHGALGESSLSPRNLGRLPVAEPLSDEVMELLEVCCVLSAVSWPADGSAPPPPGGAR